MVSAANTDENSEKGACPEALKPYRWKPGQSGNPKGRPKKEVSERIRDLLERSEGAKATELAQLLLDAATGSRRMSQTQLRALDMLLDRAEGRPKQRVEAEVYEGKKKIKLGDGPEIAGRERWLAEVADAEEGRN